MKLGRRCNYHKGRVTFYANQPACPLWPSRQLSSLWSVAALIGIVPTLATVDIPLPTPAPGDTRHISPGYLRQSSSNVNLLTVNIVLRWYQRKTLSDRFGSCFYSQFISQLKLSPLFRALALKCEIKFVCSSVHFIFYQTKMIGNWGLLCSSKGWHSQEPGPAQRLRAGGDRGLSVMMTTD